MSITTPHFSTSHVHVSLFLIKKSPKFSNNTRHVLQQLWKHPVWP